MARIWIRRLNTIARIVGTRPMAQFAFAAGLSIQFTLAACKGVWHVKPKYSSRRVVRGDGGEGTEFVIVYAITSLEARDTVKNEFGLTDDGVGCAEDAIDTLDSQYGGMAILSTF